MVIEFCEQVVLHVSYSKTQSLTEFNLCIIAVLYALGTIISLAGTGFLIGFSTQLKLVREIVSITPYPIPYSLLPYDRCSNLFVLSLPSFSWP